jgi:hypothetical protein
MVVLPPPDVLVYAALGSGSTSCVAAPSSSRQSLRLAGCVFVSTVCLLLPQYAFLRIALPRIAGVDSQQQVEATLALHTRYDSWGCEQEPEPLAVRLENHRAEIERDRDDGDCRRMSPSGEAAGRSALYVEYSCKCRRKV